MKIGLIDVDAFNRAPKYQNLALMKISAWHKSTYGIESDPEIITIADRIREMSDEELKEFICSILQCEFCKFAGWGECELLEWLQQPAEEG